MEDKNSKNSFTNGAEYGKKYRKHPELHLHARDIYDSDNKPEDVCRRLQELGAPGFALTQHGCLSAVESMKTSADKHGLKFIPGIETYYGREEDLRQNRHLILLSKDYQGYKAIWQAVSASQNSQGLSVMDDAVLEKFFGPDAFGHGHVIATSACVQGVLAAVLRSNDEVEREILKIEKRKEKAAEAFDEAACKKAEEDLAHAEKDLAEKTAERDEAAKQASMKFGMRKKYVAKLEKAGDAMYEMEAKSLADDQAKAAEAAACLPELKAAVTSAKRQVSACNRKVSGFADAKDHLEGLEKEIRELKLREHPSEDLLQMAVKEAERFRNLFGDGNFYIELQNHNIKLEAEIYPKLVQVARKTGIPVVATNDVHIVTNAEGELLKRQTMKALRFKKWENRQEGDDQLYIKTDEEMYDAFRALYPDDVIQEAFANTDRIFDSCNVVFPKESHYPKFKPNRKEDIGKPAAEILKQEILRGIKWRFPEGLDQEHKDRLNHEYKIITSMGYADYHLIVKDFLEYGRALSYVPDDQIANAPYDIEEVKQWCRENGWHTGFCIGPGRGSAVGSLVCYLLGITNLDPLKYGLLFERFLNPERVSMPDIDSDLSYTVREKVIGYVRHKYGENAVCGIMTVNAQAPKGCIRIAAKYYGILHHKEGAFLSLGDKMAKQVPMEPKTAFDTKEENGKTVYETLMAEFGADKDAKAILEWAKNLEGVFTSYGAHAAGMVISDNSDVREYIPLRWNAKLSEYTTQTDMIQTEAKGLLKMDMLGLRTLDIITDCLRMIETNTGRSIDPLRDIPIDDENVYREIFAKADTDAVFQFESDGMKTMLRRFKPEKFTDLVLLNAMFRPGPLQYLNGVIEVKNSGKEPEYLTPALKPILSETYGAIAFQEQVMAIFQQLAGYSLGDADLVRRAMSKKHLDQLETERKAFISGDPERKIKGCAANGIPADAANALFDQMTAFASYAFNKSHAAAYSMNAYYTAWLKYYYPAEFLAAAMNWSEKTQKKDPLPGLAGAAKRYGIKVLPPDVNISEKTFVAKDKCIVFSMSAVRNVGKSADGIVKERREKGKYVSVQDFILRNPSVNKAALVNLVYAGAFDSFGKNRTYLASQIEAMQKTASTLRSKEAQLAAAEEALKEAPESGRERALSKKVRLFDTVESLRKEFRAMPSDTAEPEDGMVRLSRERELCGAFLSGHPMDLYPSAEEMGVTRISEVSDNTTRIMGVITSIDLRKKKKDGTPFAFLMLDDGTGEIRVGVFTRVFPMCKKCLTVGTVVEITGSVMKNDSEEEAELLFSTDQMRPARKAQNRYILSVTSYAAFHLKKEAAFRKQYEDACGHPVTIWDAANDQMRRLAYRVSDAALSYEGMSEEIGR